MTISLILDVVIGIMFIYFLLALGASFVQEFAAGLFTWRGTYLSKGIDVIMDNDPAAKFGFQGPGDWLVAHLTPKPGSTLVDRLTRKDDGTPATGADAVLLRVVSVQNHPLLKGVPDDLPSYIPSRKFSQALVEVLKDDPALPVLTQIEVTIAALPPGDLKTTLTAFLGDAAGDADRFRANVETWFDDAMDRLSGIYKRFSQYTMLFIGMVLAVALNVNTVHVVTVLWETPSLRAVVAAQAEQAVAPGHDLSGTATQTALCQVQSFESKQLPIGWAHWHDPAPAAPAQDGGKPDVSGLTKACPQAPAGPANGSQGLIKTARNWVRDNGWAFAGYFATSIPGWFMTAVAVSLGAPFWFELLQNVINLRNAGAKPDRADDKRQDGPAYNHVPER